jgi:HK97 family phage major capsid protein
MRPTPTARTPEQTAAFDQFKTALTALEAAISRRALIDDAERRAAGTPLGSTGDRHLDRELGNFSIVRAIAASIGLDVDAGRERELSGEIQRRSGRTYQGIAVPLQALSRRIERRVETTGGTGAGVIGTYLDGSQYIDLLRSALRIRQLGARILTGLVSNVDLPRLSAAATGYWVAENAAVTASDQTFDKVSLRPKTVGALTEFSRLMLLQSSPEIEMLVRDDLAEVLARTLDSAAINGATGGANPVGILNTSGIGSVALGTTGGALTWAAVLSLIEQVENANAPDADRGFLGNPKVTAQAMATPKISGAAQGFIMDGPAEMAGYVYKSTTLVPSNLTKSTGSNLSALIYGSWSELLIGIWGGDGVDLLVNPYESTAYPKGNVQVRAMITCDIEVRHAASFAAIVDCAAP